ncbi:hypothetical protein COU62_00115 [Candidatus Pacearchaeota archaeon CG10_big_fil_rev_8_21_14_0_10_35_219]|nr:hypothetical protein [Candidatus Pacearchaeota archaeon]OIO41847.1 MAG: hypothetical protein AUJ63_04795 [Candidatus Pacearchaeota archaeon CG1_02_35_32]PIO08480.1 MAG: hypothetical protein COU62_00115 [Candidatus Pacearchaeota archaeon CG10_big_fil_rev_8_21_14_0_10_35_219]PIY81625.1 MAG: hypothetical protein COY79_01705 [Candidatus Pacearchaeota archaeon CG_4_10_14_0_8_um_filter_35_169]PIZ80101.1 MAG: hypothetical protein COY00_02420 [Candidatus Pacearchaeota archaeon CG_4_10_14_0_2_um_filt
MPDVQKVVETKDKIMSTIKEKGPTYPARIARDAGLSPLFTSAFLSELVKERKLKLSNMKVGSSPIYYIEGQEEQLADFAEYLNHKEREAFETLKKQEILKDDDQQPAIRVALRKLKDFAIPVQVRIDGESQLFWRYFQFPDSQTRGKIRDLLSPSQTPQEPKPQKPITKEKPKTENAEEKPTQTQETIIKPRKPKQTTSEFAESIKDYLAAKDVEVLEELSVKKKEFQAKVRTDTLFGKQEYLLTAKDKKKISQDDLTIATQNAQGKRMQALFLTPGQLDTKAKDYLEAWRNIIKFEKIKI